MGEEVEKIVKTHKIALDPNNKQRTLLRQHAHYSRFAYNWGLACFKEGLDKGEWRSGYSLMKLFCLNKKEECPWGQKLSQLASENAIAELDTAVKNWRNKKLRARFPRFKSRHRSKLSFLAYRSGKGAVPCRAGDSKIKLSKVGLIKVFNPLRFDGRILRVKVKEEAGRWYAAIAVEVASNSFDYSDKSVIGIDLGLNMLATCSDGTCYENPRSLRHHEKRLRKLNKALARSLNQHGRNRYSRRRDRIKKLLAECHSRIGNIRNDVIQKATTDLVMRCSVIGIEDLNVSGMLQNKYLAKSVADASMSSFVEKLEYKCQWYGVELVKVDRFFPSTQLCSSCGSRKKMDLSERIYKCEECGFSADRDLNAALNIQKEAARIVAGDRSETKNGR